MKEAKRYLEEVMGVVEDGEFNNRRKKLLKQKTPEKPLPKFSDNSTQNIHTISFCSQVISGPMKTEY